MSRTSARQSEIWGDVVIFAACAAARIGEVAGCRVGDIDTTNWTWTVRRSLAGTMAREYALRSGESEAVAEALYEMELPRSAGGALPHTTPGALLALADRLDLLVGLFAVGANPTGSSGPFGLRRSALGAVAILRTVPALRPVTLTAGLAMAANQRRQGVDVSDKVLTDAHEFAVRRYKQQLLDAGHDHRFVTAVLPLADTPALADETLAELSRRAQGARFADLVAALQRVRRIVPADTRPGYDRHKLVEPSEVALIDVFEQVRAAVGTSTTLAAFADTAQSLGSTRSCPAWCSAGSGTATKPG